MPAIAAIALALLGGLLFCALIGLLVMKLWWPGPRKEDDPLSPLHRIYLKHKRFNGNIHGGFSVLPVEEPGWIDIDPPTWEWDAARARGREKAWRLRAVRFD